MRIIIVDTSFTRASPSSLALVRMIEQGQFQIDRSDVSALSVEVWAREIDEKIVDRVNFRSLRLKLPGRLLGLWASFSEIQLRFLWDRLFRRSSKRIVISNGFLAPYADLVSVHFSGANWLRHTLEIGSSQPQALRAGLRSLLVAAMDLVFHWSFCRNRLLAVSHSVADELRRCAAPWKDIGVIPNLAAEQEFCPSYRIEHCNSARIEFEIPLDQTVLGFCSMGHFRRKGFWNAVRAIAHARNQGAPIVFLVIGDASIEVLKILDKWCPQWRDFVIFTGRQKDTAYALSCCDGYLFPSYSEAFSLTEIEAGALGLRLYLTPHYGTEMFEPKTFNGRMLPWDSFGIADILLEEYKAGAMKAGAASINGSLSIDEARKAWRNEIHSIIASRQRRSLK